MPPQVIREAGIDFGPRAAAAILYSSR
jgi:hypothetical protein